MFDQLIAGGKASYEDFGASVASRSISPPAKKSIRESVPFSNRTYDFSAINGEIYWNDCDLEYTLEIIADNPEMLEDKKTALSGWLMNLVDAEIIDPYISGYHFVGTFDSLSYADEEHMCKTTASAKFKAYPYKIANAATLFKYALAAGESKSVAVVNNSSHRITPTLTTDAAVEIVSGGTTYRATAGTFNDEKFKLAAGVNMLTIKNPGTAECNIVFSFFEEVF